MKFKMEINSTRLNRGTQSTATVTKCEKAVELSDFRSDGGMQEESKKAAERIQMSKNSPD